MTMTISIELDSVEIFFFDKEEIHLPNVEIKWFLYKNSNCFIPGPPGVLPVLRLHPARAGLRRVRLSAQPAGMPGRGALLRLSGRLPGEILFFFIKSTV